MQTVQVLPGKGKAMQIGQEKGGVGYQVFLVDAHAADAAVKYGLGGTKIFGVLTKLL